MPRDCAVTRGARDLQRPRQILPHAAPCRLSPTQHAMLCLLCRWGSWPHGIHLWGRELGFSAIFFWLMCVNLCAHAYGRQKSAQLYLIFWNVNSHWTWWFQVHLDCLPTKPRSAFLHLPSIRITRLCYFAQLLKMWVLRLNSGPHPYATSTLLIEPSPQTHPFWGLVRQRSSIFRRAMARVGSGSNWRTLGISSNSRIFQKLWARSEPSGEKNSCQRPALSMACKAHDNLPTWNSVN